MFRAGTDTDRLVFGDIMKYEGVWFLKRKIFGAN
jgi:hypothetical protein